MLQQLDVEPSSLIGRECLFSSITLCLVRCLLAAVKGCCSEATVTATVAHREGTLLNLKSRIKKKKVSLPKCSQGRKIMY